MLLHQIAYSLSLTLLAAVVVLCGLYLFGVESVAAPLNFVIESLEAQRPAVVLGGVSAGAVLAVAFFVLIRRADTRVDAILRRQAQIISEQRSEGELASAQLEGLAEERAAIESDRARIETLSRAVSQADGDLSEARQALVLYERLVGCIGKLRNMNERRTGADFPFNAALQEMMALTDSRYGFIAEVREGGHGHEALNFLAVCAAEAGGEARCADSAALMALRANALADLHKGLLVNNDLFGEANVPGVPQGHPPLHSMIAVPLLRGPDLIGQIILANHEGGYGTHIPALLSPLAAIFAEWLDGRDARVGRQRVLDAYKRLQRQSSEILTQSHDGVVTFNKQGRVYDLNEAAERMFNMKTAAAKHLSLNDFVELPDVEGSTREDAEQYLDSLGDGEIKYYPNVAVRHGDGGKVPVDAVVSVQDSGPHKLYRLYIRNLLAGHDKAQEALLQVQEEKKWLEIQTQSIKQEMLESKKNEQQALAQIEKVERTNRVKLELLATMSHELSTPMNSILGFANVLLDGSVGGAITSGQKEYLQYIADSSKQLLGYINGVLDMSGVEDGRMEIDPDDALAIGDYAKFSAHIRNDEDLVEALFQRALELDPGNPAILSNYSVFRTNIRNEHERFETLYKYAVEADPDSALTVGNYAQYLADVRKHYDRAEELYRQAIKLDPEHSDNLANFAGFLSDIRQYHDRAESYFKKALELDPANTAILGRYAHFQMDVRNNVKLAEELFIRAMEAAPDDLSLRLDFGFFLFERGEENRARDFLDQIEPRLYGKELLEMQFYKFAYGRSTQERSESLSVIFDLLQARVRCPLFDPFPLVRRMAEDEHPDTRLLEALARVITVRDTIQALDDQPKWRAIQTAKELTA